MNQFPKYLGEGITFDDVLLVPQYSTIESRTHVDTSTFVGNIKLSVPILSANMDSITEDTMSAAMHKNGGLGILHRYATADTVAHWLQSLKEKGIQTFPSVGIKEEDIAKAEFYRQHTDNICIDIAHGDSNAVARMARRMAKIGYVNIMAGNVATKEATIRLIESGVNIVKVGIGPSSVCSTRTVTGHGVPQLTAIQNAVNGVANLSVSHKKVSIIADGGIRNSGDIVKALAFGADAVMIGGLFAGCVETPSAHLGVYRGMASEASQMAFRGNVGNNTAEGVVRPVKLNGYVKYVIEKLAGGIRSGLSYSGARNISELQENAQYVKITHNGVIESGHYEKKSL
jgi:IMP dehydrogenase